MFYTRVYRAGIRRQYPSLIKGPVYLVNDCWLKLCSLKRQDRKTRLEVAMVPVQKVIQSYKSNMNFNTREDAYANRLSSSHKTNQKNEDKESKKKFDAILERAMKQN